MATVPKHHLTQEEYLERERKAEFKSEYLDGEMFAMAGASSRHAQIVANLIFEFRRSSECRVWANDVRLNIPATGLFTYPDLIVICDKPRFLDDTFDTLLNPTVLIEVLSDSTKNYDRGEKFEHYRKIDSLREYLTIAQDKIHMEHWVRRPDSRWILAEYSDPAASIEILGVSHPIAAVYTAVELA